MVGDGPDRTKAERRCRELGICDKVRFLGKQEHVEEVLSIADLFLIPSGSETFGLAALEAMGCGVPVISSDIGGLPEVNLHGDGKSKRLNSSHVAISYAVFCLKQKT